MPRVSIERARKDLHATLCPRRPEIEGAILDSLAAEPTEGLRHSLRAALGYGLSAIELGEERSPPAPLTLLVGAREAAREGVGLDTLFRCYLVTNSTLCSFLIEEAETQSLQRGVLQRLLRTQATLFDRLLAAIGEEYERESYSSLPSAEGREAERIERLLAGELIDTSQIPYDFEAHHLGLIAEGPGGAETIRDLVASRDCRLLLIQREDGTAIAWLGGRQPIDSLELQEGVHAIPPQVSLGLGEPAQGLSGWRLTHRQAESALSIALRDSRSLARYSDVVLLASVLQNDLLITSLRALYLAPLERERDGGEVARETLRAYFATGRSVSSAAAALGVKRHTVTNRLRAIEGHLARPLTISAAEVEAILLLEGGGSKKRL